MKYGISFRNICGWVEYFLRHSEHKAAVTAWYGN